MFQILVLNAGNDALEVNTTLLREKFTIRDIEHEDQAPIVAMSNRFVLPLVTKAGQEPEVFVIRAQNMHCCIRMAAQILQSFIRTGPLMVRAEPFDFIEAWEKSCSEYENAHNLARWVVVYTKGKEVFSFGSRHPFFDVIERCDSKNPGNYDKALLIAEETFGKLGKKVSISYDANIGMVLNVKPEIGRCGLIHRGPEKNATFNFVTEPKEEGNVSPVLCMNVCAAFLEGLQLAYKIGMVNDKLRLMIIEKYSTEAKVGQAALKRLAELNIEVRSFENRMDVRYRPEKPEFSMMVIDAERFHRKTYEAKQAQVQAQ